MSKPKLMSTQPIDDEPIDPLEDSITPCLWNIEVTACQSDEHVGKRVPLAAVVEPIARQLGIDLSVAIDEYVAHFSVLAPNEENALLAAKRRWFYLADDLELPAWPSTHSISAIDDL